MVRSVVSPSHKLSSQTIQVLELFKKNQGHHYSVRELMDAFNVDYKTMNRRLQTLFKNGYIRRYPGQGNSFVYKFFTDDPTEALPPQIVKKKSRVKAGKKAAANAVPGGKVTPLPPGALDQLMSSWSEKQWEPKIFNSAKYLPRTLARVYELAVESAYGSPPNQAELDDQRRNLNEFKTDLEAVLLLLRRIMVTRELWDPKTSPQFVMANAKDIDEYKRMIQGVKELN